MTQLRYERVTMIMENGINVCEQPLTNRH